MTPLNNMMHYNTIINFNLLYFLSFISIFIFSFLIFSFFVFLFVIFFIPIFFVLFYSHVWEDANVPMFLFVWHVVKFWKKMIMSKVPQAKEKREVVFQALWHTMYKLIE